MMEVFVWRHRGERGLLAFDIIIRTLSLVQWHKQGEYVECMTRTALVRVFGNLYRQQYISHIVMPEVFPPTLRYPTTFGTLILQNRING
ncbi:hypothetical protein TNCV_3041211 [Trichonephila clavipes]|nr:hypothetical protein TNCV_3041211 [Trichonephila clavipes]